MRRGRDTLWVPTLVLFAVLGTACVRRLHDRCRTHSDCPRAALCAHWFTLVASHDGRGGCEIPCKRDEDCPAQMACQQPEDVARPICFEKDWALMGRRWKVADLHERCDDNTLCLRGRCSTLRDHRGEQVQRCELTGQ